MYNIGLMTTETSDGSSKGETIELSPVSSELKDRIRELSQVNRPTKWMQVELDTGFEVSYTLNYVSLGESSPGISFLERKIIDAKKNKKQQEKETHSQFSVTIQDGKQPVIILGNSLVELGNAATVGYVFPVLPEIEILIGEKVMGLRPGLEANPPIPLDDNISVLLLEALSPGKIVRFRNGH